MLGSARQLAQVVRNLLDNAARHANAVVRVGVVARDDRVLLWVADDGPGIAVEDRSRVFARFTRLDAGRARDAGGTGLGLALVKRIVDAHDGDVRITDRVDGSGARFEVDLPAYEPIPHAPAPAPSPADPSYQGMETPPLGRSI